MKWKKGIFKRAKSSMHVMLASVKEASFGANRRMKWCVGWSSTPATIVWCPKTNGGFGASPFNKNCWRTIEGGPIILPDVAKSEKKIGVVPSSPEDDE